MQNTHITLALAPMIRLPYGSAIRADLIKRVGVRFDIDRRTHVLEVNREIAGSGDDDAMQAEADRIIAERDAWSDGVRHDAEPQADERDQVIIATHARLLHDLVVEAIGIDAGTGEITRTPHGTIEQVRAALDALRLVARNHHIAARVAPACARPSVTSTSTLA